MLKKFVREFFLRLGYSLTKSTSQEELAEFFKRTCPKPPPEGLIRVGSVGDGGYLIPNNLDGISACFSPGTSKKADFEQDLANFGIRSYLCDFSVDAPPIQNPMFSFWKKYIGIKNDEICMRLDDWICQEEPNQTDDLILQMDIEGSEYPALIDTPTYILKRFRIMVIEFHHFAMLYTRDAFRLLNALFYKIQKNFTIVHIHPNNACHTIKYGNYDIPVALEITFYRNDFFKPTNQKLEFPHALDGKNVPGKPDRVLPAFWWKG